MDRCLLLISREWQTKFIVVEFEPTGYRTKYYEAYGITKSLKYGAVVGGCLHRYHPPQWSADIYFMDPEMRKGKVDLGGIWTKDLKTD